MPASEWAIVLRLDVDLNEAVENELEKLEAMTEDLVQAGVQMLSPIDEAAPMTKMELLATGFASRTFSCAEGFCTLV